MTKEQIFEFMNGNLAFHLATVVKELNKNENGKSK